MLKDSIIFAVEAYFLTFVIAMVMAIIIKILQVLGSGKKKVAPAEATTATAQPTKKEE